MKNFYEVLEVSENASQEVIDKAYRTLAKKYHPDIQPVNKLFWAETKLKELNEAYEVLSNPSSREKYNLKIGLDSNDNFAMYSENIKLKRELENEKIKNATKNYKSEKSKNKKSSFFFDSASSYFQTIKSLIYEEKMKPAVEKQKDLKALLITIVIMCVIIFLFFKIPFLRNFMF